MVALNLQTSFLSPPVAMAPFYLKGVAPAHVTINEIFSGVMPFIVIVAGGDGDHVCVPRGGALAAELYVQVTGEPPHGVCKELAQARAETQ